MYVIAVRLTPDSYPVKLLDNILFRFLLESIDRAAIENLHRRFYGYSGIWCIYTVLYSTRAIISGKYLRNANTNFMIDDF